MPPSSERPGSRTCTPTRCAVTSSQAVGRSRERCPISPYCTGRSAFTQELNCADSVRFGVSHPPTPSRSLVTDPGHRGGRRVGALAALLLASAVLAFEPSYGDAQTPRPPRPARRQPLTP